MSVIRATDSTYADLIARPGLTLVMYDLPNEPFRNDRRLRAAFRNLERLHPEMRLVYVDMNLLAAAAKTVTFLPTFRMFRDGEMAGQWYGISSLPHRGLIVWAESHLPDKDRTETGAMDQQAGRREAEEG